MFAAGSVLACKFQAIDEPLPPDAEAGRSGAPTVQGGGGGGKAVPPAIAGSPSEAAAGAAGQANPEGGAAGESGATSESGAAGESSAGAGGEAGASSAALECTIGTTCTDSCELEAATCVVAPFNSACEFSDFAGSSAEVACGQTATVATACCGLCGCVDVVVHFDGQYCWQGIPSCMLETVQDKLFRL